MTNEPEWKDANPDTENLPVKGRGAITFIAGGIAIAVLAIVGMRVRPLGLAFGGLAFISGIMLMVRRRKFNYKPGLIVTVCGFFLLLSTPRFGIVAGFAGFFLIVVAVALVIFGIFRAVKLAWELGKFS